MKLVVILGAGASADFGVPTLRPLFREAYAVRYLAKNKWLAEHLQHIFWGPRGHTLNTSDKSLTVEEMLTLLRDWEKQSSIPKLFSTAELAKFRKSIFTLIYQALYFGKSSDGRFLNPLIEFADKQSENVTGQETTCLFTFMPQALPWDVRGPRSEPTRNALR